MMELLYILLRIIFPNLLSKH